MPGHAPSFSGALFIFLVKKTHIRKIVLNLNNPSNFLCKIKTFKNVHSHVQIYNYLTMQLFEKGRSFSNGLCDIGYLTSNDVT